MATTTPTNPDSSFIKKANNPRTREMIVEYNEVAKRAAKKEGVLINDLFAHTVDWPSSAYVDYCHFTPENFEKLGKIVADFISEHSFESLLTVFSVNDSLLSSFHNI